MIQTFTDFISQKVAGVYYLYFRDIIELSDGHGGI